MFPYFGESHSDRGTATGIGTLQAVRGYWQALRHGEGVPRRADIDPRGMVDSLERIFLIERIAAGQARFRLAGMHLADLMGMDLRGMPLSALFDASARARLANALEQVFAASCLLEIAMEAERGLGRKSMSGRMIVLPLQGDAQEPALALGCLVTEGAIGRVPRRFAISGIKAELIAPESTRLQLVASAVRPVVSVASSPARRRLQLVHSAD